VTYLAGALPSTRDAAAYVWGFWWVARQVTHLGDPWATSFLAAPVGTQLAYHTLMPLPGLLMTPVTLLFGPSASYNLLSIACPGLLCYAMYRAARLWLPTGFGAIAAGAFFGLSSNLAWRSWYQVNLALGALFLPLTLAAAVRLRRTPSRRQAAVLGLVLGAALLTDQESSVLAAVLAGLILILWLVRPPGPGRPSRPARLRLAAVCAAVAALVASPQIIAMIWQRRQRRGVDPRPTSCSTTTAGPVPGLIRCSRLHPGWPRTDCRASRRSTTRAGGVGGDRLWLIVSLAALVGLVTRGTGPVPGS
jgi:hypothetical protein